MIQDLLDELIAYVSESGREGEIGRAKELYFQSTGGLLGYEDSYDRRAGAFLEWCIFDRSVGGKTILEEYSESIDDDDRKKIFLELRKSIRSIFEVRKVQKNVIQLKDLKDGKKYFAANDDMADILKKRNIIEGRLLPYDGQYYLSGSCVFHPEEARKFIVSCLQEADSRGDLNSAINLLSIMSLKLEKYRDYKVERVYR